MIGLCSEATTIRGILSIVTCLILGAALGAQESAAPRGESPPPAAATAPASRPADLDGSGSRLLDTTPRIIQPRSQRETAPPAPPAAGDQVVERRARILKIAGANWFLIRYEPGPKGQSPPQLLLPCQLLEQIESCAEGNPPPAVLVSGETTWYHRRSFLLLREVISGAGDGPPAVPGGQSAGGATARAGAQSRPVALTDLAGEQPADANAVSRPSDANAASRPLAAGESPGRPASMPATATSGPGGAEAEEIIRRLSSQRPGKSLGVRLTPSASQPAGPSVAPLPTQPAVSSALGTMIADRVVQIYPDEKTGWWAGHFLGDNTLREPPVRLLPCPLLEEAEKEVATSPRHLKFRISGEMTEYKGLKYLLLRKLVVEKDLGQL